MCVIAGIYYTLRPFEGKRYGFFDEHVAPSLCGCDSAFLVKKRRNDNMDHIDCLEKVLLRREGRNAVQRSLLLSSLWIRIEAPDKIDFGH